MLSSSVYQFHVLHPENEEDEVRDTWESSVTQVTSRRLRQGGDPALLSMIHLSVC